MAFVNDYLTKEEIEEFGKRAIPYPAETGNRSIIGYRPNVMDSSQAQLVCTLDREEKIYLFYCGKEKYDFETPPHNHYFELVWDKEFLNQTITITMKRSIIRTEGKKGSMTICWQLISLPSSGQYKRDIITSKLKEALLIYGLDGDPESKLEWIVHFEFGGEC